MARTLSASYNIVMYIIALITQMVGTILPSRPTATESKDAPDESSAETEAKVKALRKRKVPKEDQQLYNGNQVSKIRNTGASTH